MSNNGGLPMTEFTRKRLHRDLAYVREKVKEALLQIGEAGGTSDWHDNWALDQAYQEYEFYCTRQTVLEKFLHKMWIIEPPKNSENVEIGSSVIVRDEETRTKKKFTLLGQADAGRQLGWISYLSPIGKKLLGKRVGSVIRFKVGGNLKRYQLLAISPYES
ncbi:GreA/GreB family elongation factor [Candidatus Microgenomates bacterium]|nr:GreA/GreB family elongation factor [Candidatus Microgenomates bacterium]